jgi:hypothetical protein
MTSYSEYYKFILDDSDGDSSISGGDGGGDGHDGGDGGDGHDGGDGGGGGDGGDGCLDTRWITEYENQFLLSDYDSFLKKDILRVSFQFIYLDRGKRSIEFVIPMTEPYHLQTTNQITQNELLRIIHIYQNIRMKDNKKYYNFHSLLLYDFKMPENGDNDNRWVSDYLSSSCDEEYDRIVEYTNLLSFDTIYFSPLISMFHDLIGFTVVLYED